MVIRAPFAQKIADEVIFRRFQGERVEFLKIGPFGFKPFQILFLSGFYIKIMF